jgi:potassium efflux system protein
MPWLRTILLAVLMLVATTPVARGQTPSDQLIPPSPDEIRAIIDSLDASAAGSAVELYREALARLARAADAESRAAKSREDAADAPTQLDAIRAELAEPSPQPVPETPADATVEQLEQGEAEAIARLAAARQLTADLQAEAANRQERRAQFPEILANARQRLTELETVLQNPPSASTDPVLTAARRAARLAEYKELQAEIAAIDAELANYDARRDLLPARRDLETRRVAHAEQLVDAWRSLVASRRLQEATQTVRQAERLSREATKEHPVLRAFASETERLAALRTRDAAIPQRISLATQRSSDARASFNELRGRYISVRQRVLASGLNRATGLLLRREFESLPDAASLARELRATQRELADVEYLLLERREARVGSDDINDITQRLLEEVAETTEPTEGTRAVARDLAEARRDILGQLETDAERYQDSLVELELVLERLLLGTTRYEALIKERILWVRSIAGGYQTLWSDLTQTIAWFTDLEQWNRAVVITLAEALGNIPMTALLSVLAAGTIVISRAATTKLRALADLVGKYRTDAFVHTLRAAAITIPAAAPVPLILWLIGLALAHPPEQVSVAVAVGDGLRGAAMMLIPLSLLKRLLKPSGLADAHFKWPQPALAAARRQLSWFVPVVIPAAAITIAMDRESSEPAVSSVGRLAFTVAMISFAVLVQRLARPRGPLAAALIADNPNGWLERLRYLWYPLLIVLPLTLCVVAWLGYFYTALQIQLRIEQTIALALALMFVNGILLRWLFVARRRVAVEDARRRREQAIAEAADDQSQADSPTESSIPPIDEDKVNLPGISSQSRQLFTVLIWSAALTGLILIWADVLPALRMLDRVEIYPTPRVVEAHVDASIPIFEASSTQAAETTSQDQRSPTPPTNADQSTTPTVPGVPGMSVAAPPAADTAATVTISLADIGLAIIVLIATLVAFRNLPGLIEIVVLQRLPLDAGSRYALATVIRYAIAIIGIVAAFGAVNIAWSNIQWLAAALTFGLAFGLQEIFANFISGLIILAERPIRIGDTVTVGSVSGNVTRIRMRATTITDWDRKELIIPNKNFITGDVINWTLSDALLRLTIPVGVAYDADVRLAEKTLVDVAKAHPNVMTDPKPYVLFNAFGDSTLDFQLRIFIPHIDHLIAVRHDLHFAIIEAFRKEGIEIAFPQRDLHIRSINDLAGLVQHHEPDGRTDK